MSGRKLAVLVGLVSILACASAGAQPLPKAADLSAGVYSLSVGTLTINADGTMSVASTPLTLLKVGGGPIPPAPPSPDVLTERAKAIRDKALTATGDPDRNATAKQLAALYTEIGKKITSTPAQISGQDMIAFAVKYGSDTLLLGKGASSKAAWQPTRDLLSDQWTALLQKGATDAEYAQLLAEAAAGLNASSPSKEAIDLAMIMQIIEMILKFIAMLS